MSQPVRIFDVPAARVPELIPLAREFYAQGDLPGAVDPETFCRNWSHWLFHGQAILIAAEAGGEIVGCIGGLIHPDARDGALVANEHHWFVTREHRRGSTGMDLWRAFEAEAMRRGAVRATMVHLANRAGERLASIFRSGGYQPVETHYVRDLVQPSVAHEIDVIDDFLPLPEVMRRMALSRSFDGHEYAGHVYRGVAPADDMKSVIELEMASMGRPIDIKLSFFRSGRREGDDPTTYIHADNAVPAKYAGVLYLTSDDLCVGGTAFWRHRQLNWERLPARTSEELAKRLNRDGQDERAWDRTNLVQMKFNRFVAYPTDIFHSRYPREGFGSTLEDGRLVYVCFFDMKED